MEEDESLKFWKARIITNFCLVFCQQVYELKLSIMAIIFV